MKVNLFSITKALEEGWQISNDGAVIILPHKQIKLRFDNIIPTETGNVVGIVMYPSKDHAHIATSGQNNINIDLYHCIMGHTNENSLCTTAKFYGINLLSNLQPCCECAMAKAKQKPVKKYTNTHSTKPGERLY
jgi:hypothetical protein